jgi:hypothetical protein
MTTGRMEPTVEIITITGFVYMFLTPFISGCSDAIWYYMRDTCARSVWVRVACGALCV